MLTGADLILATVVLRECSLGGLFVEVLAVKFTEALLCASRGSVSDPSHCSEPMLSSVRGRSLADSAILDPSSGLRPDVGAGNTLC